MVEKPFILGVNYWPRRKAMAWWKHFDPGEVRDEFAMIADLGLSLIRIFLLWEDFQPAPYEVSRLGLEHLNSVCDIAADLNLKLDITFFVGHMSGPSWVPNWMLQSDLSRPPDVRQVISEGEPRECGYANPFSDPKTLSAESILIEQVVQMLKDHPAIGIWNLGNEPDLFAKPVNSTEGRRWIRNLVQFIRRIDPEHPITCGLHVPNLIEDNGLRVSDIFAETDLAVIHGYPMYHEWSGGPLDLDFLPFLCWLTSALCGKPVLMEEFGGPTAAPGMPSTEWKWKSYGKWRTQFVASEQDFAWYIEQTLPRLKEVGALGALLWCFADYIPELYKVPPCDESLHERFFGLVRPDGRLKPHADVIRKFARTNPLIQTPHPKPKLPISSQEFYLAPLKNTVCLYQDYRERHILR